MRRYLNVEKLIIMNGKLLDTNCIIDFLKGKISTPNFFALPHLVYISQITVGELLYGAELSQKVEQNKATYLEFCEKFQILPVDFSVATEYAKIKASLKKQGTPIPENDIWIASTAFAHNLTIVTSDKHFSKIENLDIERI